MKIERKQKKENNQLIELLVDKLKFFNFTFKNNFIYIKQEKNNYKNYIYIYNTFRYS